MKKIISLSLIVCAVSLFAALCTAATHNEYEGFYGATPVAQQGATVDPATALVNYGLLAGSAGGGTVSQDTNVNTGVTLNARSGVITTQSASTAAATAESGFTLTNSAIASTSVITCQIVGYSGTWATNGYPNLIVAAPGTGTVVIKIANSHAANALSGTMKIHFIVH